MAFPSSISTSRGSAGAGPAGRPPRSCPAGGREADERVPPRPRRARTRGRRRVAGAQRQRSAAAAAGTATARHPWRGGNAGRARRGRGARLSGIDRPRHTVRPGPVVALGRQRRTFLRNAVAAAAQTEMQELAQQRPRRAPRCVAERRQTAAAAPSYVLKDAAGRRYMRLSEEGFFLWQQIDGTRTLRDLCVAYVERCRRPAPAEALRTLARLHAEGFLALAAPRGTAPSHPRRDALRRLASLCTCYASLPDVDRRVTALYHALRFLYAALAQAVLLVLAGAGAVAFGWLVLTGAPIPAGTLAHASPLWLPRPLPPLVL